MVFLKTKTIKQSVEFAAKPREVFEALMDEKKHGKFTGGKAVVSRKVGGKFTVFNGWASGENLEIIPDKKIMQSWRAQMDGWPNDYFSIVTFSFEKTKHGTKIVFKHSGVPEKFFEELSNGWKENYWEPMKKLLEKGKK